MDSLRGVLATAPSDSLKIRVLKEISWEYLNSHSNGDLAARYIDSIHQISVENSIPWGIALSHYQYAVLDRQRGNYGQALVAIQKYLDYWQSMDDERAVADGMYQKAIILDDLGSVEESLNLYYKILKHYEQRKDTFSIATTLNALGEILKKTGRIEESMKSYSQALRLFDILGSKRDMANCLYNIGDTHLLSENFGEAHAYFNRALALDQEMESDWGMAYDYEAIGKVYGAQGDHGKALDYHGRALAIRKDLQQKKELAMSYYEIGLNHLQLKNFAIARTNLLNAIEIQEAIGSKPELQDSYETISRLFEETGEWQNALAYKEMFIKVKDSLFNASKSGQIEELLIRFDTEKKQAAIAALEKDAQINELQLKRQRTYRNITIGLAVGVLLFLLVLFNRHTYRQKVRRENEEKQRMVAEEKRKTEQEKKRVEELQQLDKLKDEFLANTSHELRTPLHGIIGLTESLKAGVSGELPARAIENLDMIANSGKRLAHLVNDILDFSKLKNSDLKLNLAPVDLHSLTDVVLQLLAPLIRDKGLEVRNEVSENCAYVLADENRLQQILYNLAGNAIKFTHQGSISISARQNDDRMEIAVSDTGIGIPEEMYAAIFESFRQLDGSEQRQFGGTGLGLAVTKQLVELHGGAIWVASEPGQGSVFTFTLPLCTTSNKTKGTSDGRTVTSVRPAEPRDEVEGEIIPDSSGAWKVLVVDDEAVNRRVLRNYLLLAGYSVTEASNGQKALDLIASNRFDLVLLDVMMPGLSGFEVCEIVRKKFLSSELPIVLLTAKNRVSDLVYGFNVGANDYLTKPFSRNELLSRIKTHLHLHGIHVATSRFVPSEFIKSVGRDTITDVILGDHVEKEMTVFFSDVREYTRLAENMTPRQNFKFVNSYVGKMGPLIQKNNGFVNQYLGDGIMALFPGNPADALKAAIDMQAGIREYNKARLTDGYAPISVGMGMHTGPLVLGIIGDISRNETAIISDTVNTASRMEGLTKHYGAQIIISEPGIANIKDKSEFSFRFLGKVKVKGKDKAMGIYECFDGDTEECRKLKFSTLKDFSKAMDFFQAGEFPKAGALFDNILRKNPNDAVARYFVGKAAEFTLSGVSEDSETINTLTKK